MWFDGIRQPNTLYIANTSRGKDSTAMLRAIELMGWPLDMICAVDVWATQNIPAELPPMIAFKDDYDCKVYEWFGVPVTRLCATDKTGTRVSYEDIFYRKRKPKRERDEDGTSTGSHKPLVYRGTQAGSIAGFPWLKGAWCQSRLKGDILDRVFQTAPERGAKDKYRSLHWNCGRRDSANSKAHAEGG